MEEALLQVKRHRVLAEELRSLAGQFDDERKAAVAAKEAAERALQTETERYEKALLRLKAERERSRNLRLKLVELQHEIENPAPQKIEVISFIDSCGHAVVVNVTGTARKLKVYRALIQDAMNQGVLRNDEHYNYSELIKSGTVDELMGAVQDSYINTGACSREGFDPITAIDEWPGAELDG